MFYEIKFYLFPFEAVRLTNFEYGGNCLPNCNKLVLLPSWATVSRMTRPVGDLWKDNQIDFF